MYSAAAKIDWLLAGTPLLCRHRSENSSMSRRVESCECCLVVQISVNDCWQRGYVWCLSNIHMFFTVAVEACGGCDLLRKVLFLWPIFETKHKL